jgi:hypothetical protein
MNAHRAFIFGAYVSYVMYIYIAGLPLTFNMTLIAIPRHFDREAFIKLTDTAQA